MPHTPASGLIPPALCPNPPCLPPAALVKMGSAGEEEQVIPIHQLDPVLFHTIPKLKQQAVQSW